MKFFTKEVKIAVVSIIGIVVLFYGLQFLKGLTVFSSDDSYYVAFDDVSGLSASSPVYANGYRVGVVKDIVFNYEPHGKILAVMDLDKELRLPQGSRAELASDLLGNIKINLVLGDDPIHMVAKGDTIPGGEQAGIMSKVSELMPSIESLVPKLDSIMWNLNLLLSNPALPSLLNNLENMTAHLNNASIQLNALSANLNHEVPSLMQKADATLDNTQQLTGHLAGIDINGMAASVNQTLANLNELTRKLDSNEGSLGLLMHDDQIYRHLTSTAADADSLLIDFKAHPKRYIHFSVFGRKDK